jgi:hypothetical protein
MKKNARIFLLVVILLIAAIWLFMSRKDSTISDELREFAVKDTASITRIFMADKSGMKVDLVKQDDGSWQVNKKFTARPDAIVNLLSTIRNVEVRSPVAKAAYNNVIKSLAAKGVKIEIYNQDDQVRVYYVGGPTQDQMGTFMYIENSTVPFITHIPGFDGYLTPRYIVNESDWKMKVVFRHAPDQIKSLIVVDRERPAFGFKIEKNDDNFHVFDSQGKVVPDVSQDKVIDYLNSYRSLNYEMEERSLNASQKDSLLKTTPFRTISLVDKTGRENLAHFWRRPLTATTVNKTQPDGTPYNYDIDRMTARTADTGELIVVQYYSFEKLFRNPGDFQIKSR